MARIDDDDIRRVRDASDLITLASERMELKQKGRLYWGCCPFHGEKTPSFKIDPATQLWHCFGCGKGGDVFGYIQEAERMDFVESVRFLADRAHIELKETGGPGISRGRKQRMMDACKCAEEFFHNQLMRSRQGDASKARAYLHDRGFGSAPSKTWNLGFAPGHGQLVKHLQSNGFNRDEIVSANLAYVNDSQRLVDRFFNRIMFPIHDLQGRTIAFGGRVIGKGEPKYLNTSETPIFNKSSNMFGIEKAKNNIVRTGVAVVVEGYTDVIAMHEAGLNYAVATLGTALTAQHVKMLSRFASTIVYLFDGDAAGQKAAMRASSFIDWNSAVESGRNPIELKVTILPDNLDPAEFIAAKGAQAMEEQIAQAQPLLLFSITRTLESFDLGKPEMKVRALKAALEILAPLKDSVTATDYVNIIADRLNLDYNTVFKALKETKAPAVVRRVDDNAAPEPEPQRLDAVAEKIMQDQRKAAEEELELVALVVGNVGLLGNIGPEFMKIMWENGDAEKMADALLAVDRGATPPEALEAMTAVCPQAASLLAKGLCDGGDASAQGKRAALLLRTLRTRDLERQVKNAKARMRSESSMSPEEMDKLFEETVALQKELTALRKNNFGIFVD